MNQMQLDQAAPANDNPQNKYLIASDDQSSIKDPPVTDVSKDQDN